MTDIHQNQEDRIVSLEKGQAEILSLLRPMSEVYVTMSKLGKWAMGALVVVSVLIGIILGLRNIIHPK